MNLYWRVNAARWPTSSYTVLCHFEWVVRPYFFLTVFHVRGYYYSDSLPQEGMLRVPSLNEKESIPLI